MRYFLSALVLFAVLSYGGDNKKIANEKYVIVIHGGAGTINKDIPDTLRDAYVSSITDALNIGREILSKGGSSLDAVEQVIRFLEDDPKFNAGRGAVFTSEGKHELDASIMYGKDLSCGAAAGLVHIKNPISLARLIMEKSPHVLFAGEGAEQFAESQGVELVDESYFFDQKRYDQWKRSVSDTKKGTVGCVALDMDGNITAGTSTGGMTNKMHGRVGDSPIIGAGNYADNNSCGVSCTGTGELFIRNTVAFNVSALMQYKNMSLKEAADEMIHKRLKPGDGGLIAVDKNGNYVFSYNTIGMYRGAAGPDGIIEVKIWE